jgi:hypothetical protein
MRRRRRGRRMIGTCGRIQGTWVGQPVAKRMMQSQMGKTRREERRWKKWKRRKC